MKINWDKVVPVLSWFVVVFLIWNTVGLWLMPPTGLGPVAQLAGVLGSQIFYSVLYLTEAGLLTWAKLSGRMRLRKAMLLAVFFTGVFTYFLTIAVFGFSVQMLDNMGMFLLAGICYLYWKFRTEYLTEEQAREYFKF